MRGTVEGFVPVGRRVRLFGEGWLDWSYFRSLSTERSTDPGGEGRIEVDLGPFTLTGGGGAFQARQLYSIDIDERILRQEQWGNGGAEWRITRRFLLSGGAEYRTFRYDPSARTSSGNPFAAASLNRNNTTGTVAARYKLTSMTTAIATGDVIEDEFQLSAPGLEHHPLLPLHGGRSSSGRRPSSPGASSSASATSRPRAAAASRPTAAPRTPPSSPCPSSTACASSAPSCATCTSPPRPSAPPRSAPATPTSSPASRARSTSISPSSSSAARASASARPTTSSRRRSSGVPFARVEHLYTVGGSLLRRFSDSVRVGGTVSYNRRVSTIPLNSYERWVYGISAEIVP